MYLNQYFKSSDTVPLESDKYCVTNLRNRGTEDNSRGGARGWGEGGPGGGGRGGGETVRKIHAYVTPPNNEASSSRDHDEQDSRGWLVSLVSLDFCSKSVTKLESFFNPY